MHRSLSAILAICLAGLQFLAVAAVVFSSYFTSERALLEHARALLHDAGVNTIEHSKRFLEPAEKTAELAARLVQHRVATHDNAAQLEQILFQQLQISPQFAGIYFGGQDGSFVMVMRTDEGPGPFRSKLITFPDGQRRVELIWRDADFNALAYERDTVDAFDPRMRPWFEGAQAEGGDYWTDPYIFFSSKAPGVTIGTPVLMIEDVSGQLVSQGAIGVDIEISMLSHFIANLNISENGRALIIHRNGDVIAHPDLQLIQSQNADGSLRFTPITELDDPIARTAFGSLAASGALYVHEETTSQFTYDGESYVAAILPQISDLLPWTIAVYAPESDFTALIKQNRTANLWIAAGVALLTGLIGLGLAHYIYRPVRAFMARQALISQGQLPDDAPELHTYHELEASHAALLAQVQARRESEHAYLQAFEQSARAMAQLSPESGVILQANKAFANILSTTPERLQGRNLSSLVHPDDLDQLRLNHGFSHDKLVTNISVRLGMSTQDWDFVWDKDWVWVTLNSVPIHSESGKELHNLLTIDDESEARIRKREIAQLSRDLAHLARGNTMGQMAAGLAHEINQPLTAIAQNADTALLILEDKQPDIAELRDVIDQIERQSLRAGDIIRALRNFIRKDQGMSEPFDFAEILSQTLALMQAEASEAEVQILAQLPAHLPQIEGNSVQVAQVLINLLRNAMEAMQEKDAPFYDPKAPHRITITTQQTATHLQVNVRDNGPGIAEGIQLFTQFETSKANGMGLGLSICRSLIEGNAGQLWHETPNDGGACFCFTLPLTLEARAA